jgi:hypothetical protein
MMNRRPRDPSPLVPLQPRQVPLRKRPAFVAVSSAVLGFVTGAVFWHSIGFWSFVSTIVLKGPDEELATQTRDASATARVPVHLRPTGSIGPVRPTAGGKAVSGKSYLTCSQAVPDSVDGETQVSPCPPGTIAAPTKPLAKKGDFLISAPSEPVPEPVTIRPTAPVATQAWTSTIRGPQR